MLKLVFGITLLLTTSIASAACVHTRLQSSTPVRSNWCIFVETYKISCEKRVYFETSVRNLEEVDLEKSIIYFVSSPHYGASARAHAKAERWAIANLSPRQQIRIQEIIDDQGYLTQDEFTRSDD